MFEKGGRLLPWQHESTGPIRQPGYTRAILRRTNQSEPQMAVYGDLFRCGQRNYRQKAKVTECPNICMQTRPIWF